jgi:hypothetical protein
MLYAQKVMKSSRFLLLGFSFGCLFSDRVPLPDSNKAKSSDSRKHQIYALRQKSYMHK